MVEAIRVLRWRICDGGDGGEGDYNAKKGMMVMVSGLVMEKRV